MDDIGEDLGKAKTGTTIKGLLEEIMVPVLEAHDELNQALETVRHILTTDGEQRSEHLQAFDQNATQALEHFFPGLSLELDLKVIDIKEFFKAGDLNRTGSGLTTHNTGMEAAFSSISATTKPMACIVRPDPIFPLTLFFLLLIW